MAAARGGEEKGLAIASGARRLACAGAGPGRIARAGGLRAARAAVFGAARNYTGVALELLAARAAGEHIGVARPCDRVSSGRGVAQPGSAHAWGACGRRFKSGHPDQTNILPIQAFI